MFLNMQKKNHNSNLVDLMITIPQPNLTAELMYLTFLSLKYLTIEYWGHPVTSNTLLKPNWVFFVEFVISRTKITFILTLNRVVYFILFGWELWQLSKSYCQILFWLNRHACFSCLINSWVSRKWLIITLLIIGLTSIFVHLSREYKY